MHASTALRIALAAALCAAPGAYAATAEIQFVNPDQFTDAGKTRQWVDSDSVLNGLKEHLVRQAATRLPADQKLYVDITDVNLAGWYDRRQTLTHEVRVVKQDHPPRINLAFRLVAADGSVIKQGERNLRDPDFLTGPSLGYENDSLRYEKAMLDRWLAREFGPR